MTKTSGFAPIAAADARILILGSLPSRLSLANSEYYGNPQNAFWRIMGELFDAGPYLPYEQRKSQLTNNGIAVWDVLQSSLRPGSMDADIDEGSSIANNFSAFFSKHCQLRAVCFNGKKAAALYSRLVIPELSGDFHHLNYETLPSTSPAYAAMNFAAKLEHWSITTGGRNVSQHKNSV
jgi:TDG/mug DNA glycosylase family protein